MGIGKLVREKPTTKLGLLASLRKLLYQKRVVRKDERQACDHSKKYLQISSTPCDLQKTRLSAVYRAKLEIARGYHELGRTYQKLGNLEKSHETFQVVGRLLNELEAIQKIEQAFGGQTF